MKTIENTPALETDRLILRAFTPEDAPDLFPLLRDETVNTFLPWFPLKTLAETEKFLAENYLQLYEKDFACKYAVCLRADNRPIGYVELGDSESHDLGYGLRKEFWRQGIVTEACKAVVERLKIAGIPYITATHDANNPASGKVMQKIGMQYCYSYIEQWQPKNIPVTFRMYQLNLDGDRDRMFMGYWNQYAHFIESGV